MSFAPSGEGGHHAGVRTVLEAGAAAAPEVLLLGFSQARADWGPLQREVLSFAPLRFQISLGHAAGILILA